MIGVMGGAVEGDAGDFSTRCVEGFHGGVPEEFHADFFEVEA